LSAPLLLVVTACSSIPGGASAPLSEEGNYGVQVPYTEVRFTVDTPSQTAAGVDATAGVQDMLPLLYYRYQVQSQVNGNYVAMPSPPMVYVIRKIPFYKLDPERVTVRLDLRNTTGDVVRTAQAVCSFDLNGKTVSSTPLGASTDLLPGHDLSVEVTGPTLDQLGTAPTGKMTIWLYGLGADKNQVLHWDADYVLKEEQRQVQGEILGHTNSKDEAESYEGREDAAEPDSRPPAAPLR
jgi:hypothetical protein